MRKTIALAVALLLVAQVFNITAYAETYRYIPWSFYIYEQPEFTPLPYAALEPQYVTVQCDTEYGWVLVGTEYGEKWTYISGPTFALESAANLFAYKNAATRSCVVSPQRVNVIGQSGSWLQISTWLGPKWIMME